jgi:hypothetical protein
MEKERSPERGECAIALSRHHRVRERRRQRPMIEANLDFIRCGAEALVPRAWRRGEKLSREEHRNEVSIPTID